MGSDLLKVAELLTTGSCDGREASEALGSICLPSGEADAPPLPGILELPYPGYWKEALKTAASV